MKRYDVINKLIQYNKGELYLEIGVWRGENFNKINAKYKIGIDPSSVARGENIYNMTSDEFFKSRSEIFSKKLIDVAFIDGLHTYEQSLADVSNVLKYLNKDGFIVLHDCNPGSEAAAIPAESYKVASEKARKYSDWDGVSWNGDVWKTIVDLRSSREDLNIFVLNTDQGLGIIRKSNSSQKLDYSRNNISKLSYNDLRYDKERMLNLKKQEYINEI